MNRFISMTALLLVSGAASFAQYANVLEDGMQLTVDSAWTNDTVQVGAATSSNAVFVVSGGDVFSTNVYVGTGSNATGNAISVRAGSWTIEDTLEIGPGSGNSASVGSGGDLSVGDVIIHSGNTLTLGANGIFQIGADFNASMPGFVWERDGHLIVGGTLSGMAATSNAVHLSDGRDLTLDGGTWDLSGTNLVVGSGSPGSGLHIRKGALLLSSTTRIGLDADSDLNSVTVSSGATWTNSGDLLVGDGSNFNNLKINADGTNTVAGNAWIGGSSSRQNYVQVEGSNALWSVAGNVEIGSGAANGGNYLRVGAGAEAAIGGDLSVHSGNSLVLASGGTVALGGGMNVFSNATLSGQGTVAFGSNDVLLAFVGDNINLSRDIVFLATSGFSNAVSVTDGTFAMAGSNAVQYVNFSSLNLQDTDLVGYGSVDAFDHVHMAGGTIDPMGNSAGTIEIGGDFSASGTLYRAQIYATAADRLVFSGSNPVDLSGMSVAVFVPVVPDGGTATIVSGSSLLNGFASTNIDERLLLYRASLVSTGDEVQVVVEEDHGTLGAALPYAAGESVRAGFGGMKDMVFARTK